MAKAILVDDRDFERDYEISDGRIITLIYDDLDDTIGFFEGDKYLGDQFEFIDESEKEEKYLLARMFCPIPNSGLGREAINFFIEMKGDDIEIYTRQNDGITRDDGSHLTGDAHGFILKMQKEGLINKWDFE
jgi:hypothetical protein